MRSAETFGRDADEHVREHTNTASAPGSTSRVRDERAEAPRTIGVLTTGYPRHAHDAAGLFVQGMARALRDRGHLVEVLTPAAEPGDFPPEPGIVVHPIAYAPRALRRTFYGAGVPDNVARDPRAWPGLATFPPLLLHHARARASRWDAVISHWALPCGWIGGRVARHRTHLAVLHSADVHVIRKAPMRGWLAARVAASATNLWFASAALRTEFLSWLAPRARADVAGRAHAASMGIEPPVDLPRPRRARGRFVVLVMARLVPIKGVAHAIDALADDPSVTLWIAGDGPERGPLAHRARGARADIELLGHLSGLEKARRFRAADALLVPSIPLPSGRTEGTPTVALEAASYGLPIVASEVGGLFEVFAHDRSALAVPPGSPAAIREAVQRLRGDRALRRRLSRAARTTAAAYTWPALAPRVEALLELDRVPRSP